MRLETPLVQWFHHNPITSQKGRIKSHDLDAAALFRQRQQNVVHRFGKCFQRLARHVRPPHIVYRYILGTLYIVYRYDAIARLLLKKDSQKGFSMQK